MSSTPTEKLPPVTARVGKLPSGPILTVTLDPPTVAEAIKHLKFEPNELFNPKPYEKPYEVKMGARAADRAILPEEFETTVVPDGGIVLVMQKVLA